MIRFWFLLIAILFPFAGALAECPAGMQGSSNFEEARATLQRFNETLTESGIMDGTFQDKASAAVNRIGSVVKPTPAKVVFSKQDGKLFVTMFLGEGKAAKKYGPYETEICSGGGKLVAVFPTMKVMNLSIDLTDPNRVQMATSFGDLSLGHINSPGVASK